jgi:hypothetical protein
MSESVRHLFGRWSVDERAEVLTRDDGLSVRFIGFADDKEDLQLVNAFDRRWMLFEATLSGKSYPLLVERRDVAPGSGRRELLWRLDHNRSARMSGADELEFELWRAIDQLACDALICWPEMARTGLRPARIATSGGVQDQRWTAERFRIFGVGAINQKPPDGLFLDPVIERSQTWNFQPAVETASQTREAELLRAFASAKPREIHGLVEELKQIRPHLVSRERMFLPLARTHWQTVWIYIDDVLITDRLQTNHKSSGLYADRWQFPPSTQCIVGSIDRKHGEYVDFNALTPIKMMDRRRHGLVVHEAGVFSSDQTDRFRQVVEDAIWRWQDSIIALPGIDGDIHATHICRPAIARADRLIHYGGTVFSVPMDAALSFVDCEGKSLGLENAFDESTPSDVETVAFSLGRFDFSSVDAQMRERVTDQRLTLHAILSGTPDTTGAQSAIFLYCDGEGSWPLHVRRGERTNAYDGASWTLDHVESRAETTRDLSPARWRRIQEFALDALMVWPDSTRFGPAPRDVLVHGGWFNGKWDNSFRMRCSMSVLLARTDGNTPGHPPTNTLGLSWSRGPKPTSVGELSLIDIDPAGAVSVPPIDLAKFADQKLRGRPYWRREDGHALLFVCGHHFVRRGPDGDLVQEPIFEYCDDDVRLRLHIDYDRAIYLSSLQWPRVVATSQYVEQEGVLPLSLFRTPKWSGVQPQELLWRRLVEAAEARLVDVPRSSHNAMKTKGGYVAGVFETSASRSIWREPQPKRRETV